MKILILKPSSLGDVVQALPVLRLLKARHPHSQIDWWISTGLAPLLEADPDLRKVIPFDRSGWKRASRWGGLVEMVRDARAHGYDYIIDLQSLARSGLFGWAANGRTLIGLEDTREGAPALFDISVPRPSPHTHAVDWYLRVLRHFDVEPHWNFVWMPPRHEIAEGVAAKWETGVHHWIALVPGARWENKRWPVERFAQVAREVSLARPQVRFVVLGGGDDLALGEQIRLAAPERVLNLAGRTSLPEMVEWIRLARAVVTNDTGPMHVASALGKPVVAIFGPTDPRRTGPHRMPGAVVRQPLPCSPCLKSTCANATQMQCMLGVTAGEVMSKLQTILA